MPKKSKGFVQGSFFEEDYLIRTLGPLAHSPDIALTELIANAWDAGANLVEVVIPEERGRKLVIQDDGVGLTKDEFHARWMKLGYNRIKHQGKQVQFPEGREGSRLAYGRNGIGRHGLLCFNDQYTVITKRGGNESTFLISTHSESQPFVLLEENGEEGGGHGTRLEVIVERNLPNPERMLEVISARFLHDPQFKVSINGNSVPLEDHSGLIDSSTIKVNSDVSLEVLFIDTQKSARTTLYQGVAFWQGRRLVGEPSWTLGNTSILDGRTRFAKRYTFVAQTDDLADYIREDWSGFVDCSVMNEVFQAISTYISDSFHKLAKEHLDETKVSVREEFKEQYSELSALAKLELDEVIEHVVNTHPTSTAETIGIAVEAVIGLERTRSGKALLQKLSHFSEEDIEGLNRLLDQWTIKDALSVLDEIDQRFSLIEAIAKLSSDPKVDELKVLHPLVAESRWLFGPEYDSAEYTSNRQLRTIAKKVFGQTVSDNTFGNPNKRPDLFILADSTLSVTGAEQFNSETDMVEMRRILIVELKRGGSSLTRDNKHQAIDYVEDFIGCKELTGNPSIIAFVVGDTISEKIVNPHKVGDQGFVYVTTFAQMVDTAKRRLFNLKEKISERYDGISGIELVQRVQQINISFEEE